MVGGRSSSAPVSLAEPKTSVHSAASRALTREVVLGGLRGPRGRRPIACSTIAKTLLAVGDCQSTGRVSSCKGPRRLLVLAFHPDSGMTVSFAAGLRRTCARRSLRAGCPLRRRGDHGGYHSVTGEVRRTNRQGVLGAVGQTSKGERRRVLAAAVHVVEVDAAVGAVLVFPDCDVARMIPWFCT